MTRIHLNLYYYYYFVILYVVTVEGFFLNWKSSSVSSTFYYRQTCSRRYLQVAKVSSSVGEDLELHSLVHKFLKVAQNCSSNNTLASFTICGPSKKKAKDDSTIPKGSLRMVTARTIDIKKQGIKLQVTFKYHGATDIVQNWEPTESAKIIETMLYYNSSNGITIPQSEWGPVPFELLGSTRGLQRATLECTTGDVYELNMARPSAKLRHQKRNNGKDISLTRPQPHDRVKKTPVDTNHPMWYNLGVTDQVHGKPRPGMTSKLRQCQKFVEIVGNLVDASLLHSNTSSYLSVIDMGCGRGYLTFALHWFLKNQFENVKSRGIDVRPKLVSEISGIARQLGDDFSDLRFETGSIESFLEELTVNSTNGSTNDNDSLVVPATEILIALHACDTATDDALWAGIARNASFIVVAPCCHREVRPQLNQWLRIDKNNDNDEDHPYSDILRHNIYRERMAEMVTDSIRALLLELAGYNVQVFEFIGGEHTSKNVMITAVKKQNRQQSGKNLLYEATNTLIQQRILHLATLHGIHDQKLANWMGVKLSTRTNSHRALTTRSMPSLPTET